MSMARKLIAEFLGTGWLVLGGCGSAVLAAAVPNLGIGYAGVALAFGLTVLTGAYAFGHISGAHFNPAVTLGLAMARRFPLRDVLAYWIVQVAGAIVAAAILYVIASGAAGFDASAGFAKSAAINSQRRPRARMASLVARESASSWRALMTTCAPSRASAMAVAAPMPLEPPVTSAVLSLRFI